LEGPWNLLSMGVFRTPNEKFDMKVYMPADMWQAKCKKDSILLWRLLSKFC
jgi:hypothetical protein